VLCSAAPPRQPERGDDDGAIEEPVELGRITTDIPARMDRSPWASWHWLIVLGLTSSDVGLAGAIYVTGACLGALSFGQLTDRFGRKKLFMVTLGVYLVGTVATAFSMNPAFPLLNPDVLDPELGWRFAFGLGTILGIGILFVRRYVPESPRWLFIHGRHEEGGQIVVDIEEQVRNDIRSVEGRAVYSPRYPAAPPTACPHCPWEATHGQ